MSQPRYLLSDTNFDDREQQAVIDVIRSGWLSLGPRTAAFEGQFAAFTGATHAIAVSNGTCALHLALLSVGIEPGDEVLVPSYTFVATANAIRHAGAEAVFVDICGSHDLNIDPDLLESSITPRTRAIMVVHLAGYIADMRRIMEIADRHGLLVIEDAAHAIGAFYDGPGELHGRSAGVLGHVGCFSFFANKNLVTGEGGMVTTNDTAVAEHARLARSHGMTKSSWDKAKGRATGYDVVQSGYNYRPTELTAALGQVQLEKLPENTRKRAELVKLYRHRLSSLPLELPFADRGDHGAHHILPILVRDAEFREPLRAKLLEQGVQTSVHYPPVHGFTHFRNFANRGGSLDRTEDVAAREITLPLHTGMTGEDISAICDIIAQALLVHQPTPLAVEC
jgi:dTDP-4-amino-4,6-dideoxygalactose transaminase